MSPVGRWYIADPASPDDHPREVRYPAAGTPNANVGLHVLALDGGSIEIAWDHDRFPYLAAVNWVSDERLLLDRPDRATNIDIQVLEANPTTGDTAPVFTDHDECWVELVPGTPDQLGDGRLVMTADRDGVRRLLIDGDAVTPTDMQVRAVVAASDGTVILHANQLDDPTIHDVWQWSDDDLIRISDGTGIHSASVGGATTVLRGRIARELRSRHPGDRWAGVDVVRGATSHRSQRVHSALRRPPHPHGSATTAEPRRLPLPVLLDPYAGPHVQCVLASRGRFVVSQWFADQGYAVIVIDGRGTPGRGTDWERAIHLDLASPILDDQIEGLHAAAEEFPLDLGRVAIRGWSFGGYLAALAVMRRPDVFHAAIAGAPVTDWRLYDTHYTERYLGDPTIDDTAYANSSLLPLAAALSRPLLLIHGLADDNVVAANTLQLSSALLAAGKPHEVLPLVGVTHMTPQEVVAENLMLHQLDFLRRFL